VNVRITMLQMSKVHRKSQWMLLLHGSRIYCKEYVFLLLVSWVYSDVGLWFIHYYLVPNGHDVDKLKSSAKSVISCIFYILM
jgi:hypothetical protein